MNINLTPQLQNHFNMLRSLPEHQQLSPLSRKNIFSKTKKTVSLEKNNFNPHLERLSTNYYIKENSIVPYSYTVTQSLPPQKVQATSQQSYPKNNKPKSFPSKILSLKEFSCIQTVSQMSGKQNQSDSNNELEVNRNYRPKQNNHEMSSPLDFKNFQSTFMISHRTNLNQCQAKLIRSYQLQKQENKCGQDNTVRIKMKGKRLIKDQIQNDNKTNKKFYSWKDKRKRTISLAKRTFDLKIVPTSRFDLNLKKNIDIHQSSIVFDYDKFQKNRKLLQSVQRQNQSKVHPINENMLRFFQGQKEKENFLTISNQNDSFIDIVREINSPRNKQMHRNPLSSQNIQNKITFLQKNEQTKENICSQLTCLVKQGPRSYSLGNRIRKLSGQKNTLTYLKRQSIFSNVQTRPTTDRSQYFNQLEMNTPKTIADRTQTIHCTQFPNLNKTNYKALQTQNQSQNVIRHQYLFKTPLFSNYSRNPHINSQKVTLLTQQPQLNSSTQHIHTSKNSKRRTSKGISVSSKQKRSANQYTNTHYPCDRDKIVTSKFKTVKQIKKMKRLTLTSPKKTDAHQVGSLIKFKKQ